MNKNLRIAALLISGTALVAGVTWYGLATTAEAACGASASSCKTCHEVQGKDPVSKNGDWHVQHAFGDFCEFCHGGVTKETTADKAHQGMRQPLADPQQSCGSCHAPDLADRAAKYGGTVTASTGGSTTTPATNTDNSGSNTPAPPPPPASSSSAAPGSATAKLDLIDFNRRLPGEPEPPNRGAQVLWGLNALAAVGLAGVLWKEKGPKPAKRPARTSFGEALGTTLPPEHADLVAQLASCDAATLQALEQVLRHDGGPAFIRRLAGMDLSLVGGLEHMSQEELILALSLARGQKN